MRLFTAYTIAALITVALAFAERGQHMGFSGFLAIFLCQPWLAAIWVLVALGVPIPDKALTPAVIAAMVSANVFIWGGYLLFKSRRRDAS